MTGDCVIDASVGIKLFLVEEDTDAADALFAQLTQSLPDRFYVPDLFYSECANILWKYVQHFGHPTENARQDVVDLLALRLQTVSTADVLVLALELALRDGITAYDACYAALAQQLDLPLVTANGPFAHKLDGSGIIIRRLIEETT